MPAVSPCVLWFLRVVAPVVRRIIRVRGYHVITLPGGGPDRPVPEVQLAAHPATSGRLVVIYPGLGATIDGESRHFTQSHPFRYQYLAERLRSEAVAAVVRVANPPTGYHGGGQVALDRLRRAVDYALAHARALCGRRRPELCLLGFSAGAGAAAALSGDYQPQRMLLVAPSGDVGPRRIIAGLKEYTGRLVLMVGENDAVVGRDAARLFDELSPAARRKQVLFAPDCDHFFTREDHDRLFEETSLRVFGEPDASVPEQQAGGRSPDDP